MTKNWRAQAACLDMDGELFFPTGTAGLIYDAQVAEAKAVCARCPVVAACAAESLDRGDEFGIFGGLTPDERRALRGARARQSARPPRGEAGRFAYTARVLELYTMPHRRLLPRSRRRRHRIPNTGLRARRGD